MESEQLSLTRYDLTSKIEEPERALSTCDDRGVRNRPSLVTLGGSIQGVIGFQCDDGRVHK